MLQEQKLKNINEKACKRNQMAMIPSIGRPSGKNHQQQSLSDH